ncbi:hypothetical protein GGS23DRAFT_610982 [Durotheca rogersii]|uniref:uncharacterized protein n=1 Tax=Durotheca rogersii TaxID=419775 RepID=UPI002220CA38|nr:uncharacterized protein GGS23DRAFT_610982 [Durotheca rogersii]KAI5862288.1 hypothetical protein GGS23DRAFT_610982 [Durotheca rogersii]
MELLRDLRNPGHTNWEPMEYPESLLLEVESGIMIREVQEEIAGKMRQPPENRNTLLRMLISKLGGLINRRIYHMPFSRLLKPDASKAAKVLELSEECAKEGGVLLMLPEHILSFQLMGIEYQLNNSQPEVSRTLLETQSYFNTCLRDLVDESDENFSRILDFVKDNVGEVGQEFPRSIEITTTNSTAQFLRIRLLGQGAEERLLETVATTICNTGFQGFPIHRQQTWVRNAVRTYILGENLTSENITNVEDRSGFSTPSTKSQLLLIRDLFAGGVLGFAFRQKRWKVNYGLDPGRVPETRLAVPYRAKDHPTARSEFSHPDVVVLLTYLSYYYEGLSNDDLLATFEHLIKSGQPDAHYQGWVGDVPELPRSYHNLGGVSMKDHRQLTEEIFPHFRWAKRTIDYFLSNIVFSKEMKEFPEKLAALGWDLGQAKAHPTTGFSGTYDSRQLLPLDITHHDLDTQRHTNAMVAEYLLRSENSVELTKRRNGEELLDLLEEIASSFPSGPERKQAAIFFDDYDNLCVVDRQGRTEKFQTSPYNAQLDRCLVFLDEAHTRGTDLKLPSDYRAAVTLGAGLTKHRLVQACMRMRKLEHGQSVVFCVSEKIEAQIQSLKDAAEDSGNIQTRDVLAWAIDQTFADLRRSIPLWAVQGRRFEHHRKLWEAAVTQNGGIALSPEAAKRFLEDEALTLEHRYRPKKRNTGRHESTIRGDPPIAGRLAEIERRCVAFGATDPSSSLLAEEQERELSPEIVQERQIERPAQVRLKKHEVDPALAMLVREGTFKRQPPDDAPPFRAAFAALDNTAAGRAFELSWFPNDKGEEVLVTKDFARTVRLDGYGAYADLYLRPVHPLIIISPFEAQELMDEIARSEHVRLHLYAPLPSPTHQALDHLQLYVVPRAGAGSAAYQPSQRQRQLLGLFARQLYFSSYEDYTAMCEPLGLSTQPPSSNGGSPITIEPDGFIAPGSVGRASAFQSSPVPFLKTFLLALRHGATGNEKSHWGTALEGETLSGQCWRAKALRETK